MTEIRMTVPECPACFRPDAESIHASPAVVEEQALVPRRRRRHPLTPPAPECGGKLWLDLLTGRVRCKGCGFSWDFAGTTHNCSDCGCKYEGGHTWAEGAAVTGATAEWIAAAGITDKTTITGWDEEKRQKWLAGQPGAPSSPPRLRLREDRLRVDPELTPEELLSKAESELLLRQIEQAPIVDPAKHRAEPSPESPSDRQRRRRGW